MDAAGDINGRQTEPFFLESSQERSRLCLSLCWGLTSSAGSKSKNQELIQAAVNGDLEKVAKLLGAGAAINAKDKDGRTALLEAALNGPPKSSSFFLRKVLM